VTLLNFKYRAAFGACIVVLFLNTPANAVDVILTAESTVEIAMRNGYRFKMLELSRKRNLSNLNAERASLKSKVYMNLKTPEYLAVSDYKWNSTLYMNEIIRTNTRRWQMDIAVRQPVILMGYPTNGYLSFNNRTYKYIQKEDFGRDVDYFNRFFVKLEQPLFTTNELKNDIEEAELDQKIEEMQDASDKVNEIIGVSFTYNHLLELVFRDSLLIRYIGELENILDEVKNDSGTSSERSVEEIQVGLELNNTREMLLGNANDLRTQAMRLKQRIRLENEDSLIVRHELKVIPIVVDLDAALEYGYSLSPRLRQMSLGNRKVEIDLDDEKGDDAFRLNLEISMGLENNDDVYREMWDDYSNSNQVSLFAYIPVWDWGRRKSNIAAAEISVRRAYLYYDQVRDEITNDIVTAVENLKDYQARVLAIGKSLNEAKLSYETSLNHFRNGDLSIQGILKSLERKRDMEMNYLEAYLRYKGSILQLNARTFYDYESGMSMYDKYNL
jgi:hypothetical protein